MVANCSNPVCTDILVQCSHNRVLPASNVEKLEYLASRYIYENNNSGGYFHIEIS